MSRPRPVPGWRFLPRRFRWWLAERLPEWFNPCPVCGRLACHFPWIVEGEPHFRESLEQMRRGEKRSRPF